MAQAREDRALADPHPSGTNGEVSGCEPCSTHIPSEAWIEWSAARNCDGYCFVITSKQRITTPGRAAITLNVCALRLPHASRRPQNGESGDVPPSGRGLVARPAAEGLHGRAEDTTLHPAAPTPPPSADSPMHSTRAQDAAEPCIADFRRSPSGLHEPKDEWLLPGENGHFATFLIISQPPTLKRNPPSLSDQGS